MRYDKSILTAFGVLAFAVVFFLSVIMYSLYTDKSQEEGKTKQASKAVKTHESRMAQGIDEQKRKRVCCKG